jgi:hypothetical protein
MTFCSWKTQSRELPPGIVRKVGNRGKVRDMLCIAFLGAGDRTCPCCLALSRTSVQPIAWWGTMVTIEGFTLLPR